MIWFDVLSMAAQTAKIQNLRCVVDILSASGRLGSSSCLEPPHLFWQVYAYADLKEILHTQDDIYFCHRRQIS